MNNNVYIIPAKYYTFDEVAVSNSFEEAIPYMNSNTQSQHVTLRQLMDAFRRKDFSEFSLQQQQHILIALEGVEDDLDMIEYIKNENKKTTGSLSYHHGENRGHLYIVRPGKNFEPNYATKQIFTERDDSDEPLFKIGRSCNIKSRMHGYPSFSKIAFLIECPGKLQEFEKLVIDTLNKDIRFKKVKGREWFEGNHFVTCNIIIKAHTKMFEELYK